MKRFLALASALCVLALPLGAQASKMTAAAGAMPSCSAGDPVVWVNTKSKVYHMSGDSYYGKTKSGKYVCKSAADAMGAHLSGSAKSSGSAMSSAAATAPDAMETAMPGKHHKKKKGAMAMPMATATP